MGCRGVHLKPSNALQESGRRSAMGTLMRPVESERGQRGILPTLSWVVGTIFGIGYAPVAPGTVASVVAASLWYWWYPTHWVQWAVCGVAIVAGTWAGDRLARRFLANDPSQVVIDEFAGMWVALVALPRSLPVLCVALLLFRALDIAKIPPMKQLERLPGGVGIMADDVVAGLIVRIVIGISLGVLPLN